MLPKEISGTSSVLFLRFSELTDDLFICGCRPLDMVEYWVQLRELSKGVVHYPFVPYMISRLMFTIQRNGPKTGVIYLFPLA